MNDFANIVSAYQKLLPEQKKFFLDKKAVVFEKGDPDLLRKIDEVVRDIHICLRAIQLIDIVYNNHQAVKICDKVYTEKCIATEEAIKKSLE